MQGLAAPAPPPRASMPNFRRHPCRRLPSAKTPGPFWSVSFCTRSDSKILARQKFTVQLARWFLPEGSRCQGWQRNLRMDALWAGVRRRRAPASANSNGKKTSPLTAAEKISNNDSAHSTHCVFDHQIAAPASLSSIPAQFFQRFKTCFSIPHPAEHGICSLCLKHVPANATAGGRVVIRRFTPLFSHRRPGRQRPPPCFVPRFATRFVDRVLLPFQADFC